MNETKQNFIESAKSKVAGFFLLDWSKTNYDVRSLYIWVERIVEKKSCKWKWKTKKDSINSQL